MIGRLASFLLLVGALALTPGPVRAAPEGGDDAGLILVMLNLPSPHVRPGGGYAGRYGDRLAESELNRLARGIARRHHLTLVEDWPMPAIGLDCFVMRVPDPKAAAAAVEELSREPAVQWAQPMHSYTTMGGALYPMQPARVLWRLDTLHRMTQGRGVTVAVIDSGIDTRHPDLAGQVADNRNFVAGRPLAPERHGTAVAGIIAARGDEHDGIVGVAPEARLLGLRACWQVEPRSAEAACDSLSLAKALHYAIERGAGVINLSLGGPSDRLLAMLIDTGMARGASVVAAFDASLPEGGFPASQAGVIAVSDRPVRDGAHPVYVAPGRDIPAPQPGAGWALVDGASYAAAHVSGLVSLVRQHGGGGRDGARPVIASGRGGEIDAVATLRANGLP